MKIKFFFLILSVVQVLFVKAQMDEKFYFPSKELRPIEWTNYEELKFAVENDTISTIILKPTKKPKATIFYFHGAGGNVTNYLPLTLPMVKNGFQVVMVDFRGYGKSTGTPTHKSIASDGQMIFDEIMKREDVKDNPIIIYGISIGTQVAAFLAKNNQDKIKGLVLEGAMASFGDIAAVYAPEYKFYLETSFISPYSAKDDVKGLNKISKIYIHSKEDKDVPYEQGQKVFENAPEPKVFLEFSGEHLYGMKYVGKEILEGMNKMVVANNK